MEALETRALLSFGAPVSYNIGTQPSPFNGSVGSDGVATGDFRGDGRTDLAVVHTGEETLNILLNNGDGTFQPAVSYPTGGTHALYAIVADFNGDGNADVAVLNQGLPSDNFTSTVSIFLGNGDGTFQPAVRYSFGTLARGFAVGDFNGDGNGDLVSANFFDQSVSILFGNGDGTFQPRRTISVPSAPRYVATGDFNGDGKTDLAVCHGTDPADGLSIFLGNGDGTFQPPHEYATPPTPGDGNPFPEFVTAGDLNNDGQTDLIVSNYDHSIDVFLGNGDGTFQPAIPVDTGEYPRAVAIADVNGDGIPDLVVGNIGNASSTPPEAGSVAVLLGNGDGTFQDAIQYTPFHYPGWLTVADFNGDGLPDVAVTQVQDGHAVSVMLNQPIPLTATGTAIQTTAGQDLLPLVATFTDAGPDPGLATAYTAVINWGDGTPLSTGGISAPGDGHYEVPASHTYGVAGLYTITVTITDSRSPDRTATALSTATVTDAGSPGRGNNHFREVAEFSDALADMRAAAAAKPFGN